MNSTMHRLRLHARPFAWLALCALVLQLLGAMISNVHASQQLASAADAIEICTPAGIVRINPDDGTPAGPVQQGAPAPQHCPFCTLHHAGFAPVVVAMVLLLPPTTATVSVPAPAADPLPLAPDLRHAPSRAPPARFA